MAHSSTYAQQAFDYADKGNVTDYSDIMTVLLINETPWISVFNKPSGAIDGTPHNWLTRSYGAASAANAQIDGADAPNAEENTPTKISNEAQIFTRTVNVGAVQEAVAHHTYSSELAEQRMIIANRLKRDLDQACLQCSASAAAASATGAKFPGFPDYIATNTCAMSTGGAMTTTIFGTALQNLVTASGKCPDLCIAPPAERQEISLLYTRTVNDNITKVSTGNVQIIATDFGDVKLAWDTHCCANTVALINTDAWDLKYLRGKNWQKKRLAEAGFYTKEAIMGVFLQICYNESANYWFTQVST